MSTEPREAREEERALPTVAIPSPVAAPAAPHVESAGRTVVLDGLHAYYGDTAAVKGVELTFAANDVTALIGPSGCGKSTVV
jgi:phosphate transport system ATP-binding protein